MKTLIVKDSNEEYHSKKEFASSSVLKNMKRSPLHMITKKFESTPALEFGSAYHEFILEPDLFEKNYFIFDESNRPEPEKTMASSKNKTWKQDVLQAHENVLPKSILKVMEDMKEQLFKNRFAVYLLTKGENEISHYLELDGSKCKFRPDSMFVKKRTIADLKTVADASIDGFLKYVTKFDAHLQSAFYCDLFDEAYGDNGKLTQFYWVAQEKTFPYAVNILKASHQLLQVGRYEYKAMLDQWQYCQDNKTYKGYEVFANNKFGVTEISLPAWKIKEINFYNQF